MLRAGGEVGSDWETLGPLKRRASPEEEEQGGDSLARHLGQGSEPFTCSPSTSGPGKF